MPEKELLPIVLEVLRALSLCPVCESCRRVALNTLEIAKMNLPKTVDDAIETE